MNVGSAAAAALTVCACHPVDPRAERIAALTGDPAAGAEIYERDCLSCHGVDGVGTERALHGDRPVNLATASEWYAAPVFLTMIVDGVEGTDMAAYGPRLEDQEIADVYACILAFPE